MWPHRRLKTRVLHLRILYRSRFRWSETFQLIEHQLQKSQITTVLDAGPELLPVKGNGGKLQQVLLNLFLNARDAMEPGGTLAVSTSVEEAIVRAVVTDTGSGIAPANVPRIFDPFFTTKAARKGTGLGLSVSYGIVMEHSGDIEVESQPGKGTRFVLTFPEAGAPAAKTEPLRAVPAPPASLPAPASTPSLASTPAAAILSPAPPAPSLTAVSTSSSAGSSVPVQSFGQSDTLIH